ncbi:MAG: VanZ family protein [Nitrospirota bacterium]|nr:VanZ family protein [Nitrospirota bacterium]
MQVPVAKDINDKINHLAAFYTLALLVDFSWPKKDFLGLKAISLLGYGLAIEIAQYFLPQRNFSLLDLGADAVGLLLYLLSAPLLRNIPLLSMRFKTGEE